MKNQISTVTVNRVLSLDRKGKFSTDVEVKEFFDSIDENQIFSVELKQVVPNEVVNSTEGSLLSLANRIAGHKNLIAQKEEKVLMTWLSFTKGGYEKLNLSIGKELEGVSLRESYVSIKDLTLDFGLDSYGNLTIEPVSNPTKSQILLYGVDLMPMFRKVELVEEEYSPVVKPTHKANCVDFDGVKRNSEGRKTEEYQKFLNELYAEYCPTLKEEEEFDMKIISSTSTVEI